MRTRIYVALALALTATACGKSEEEKKVAAQQQPQAPAPGPAPQNPAPAPTQDCLPITGNILFQFNDALISMTQVDQRLYRIVVGKFPQETQAYGQITLGGPGAAGPIGRQGVDGNISFMLNFNQQPTPTGNGLLNSQSSGSGYIQISPAAQSDILAKVFQGVIQIPSLSGGAGNTAAQAPAANQICVSAIAIQGGTLQTGNINQFYGDAYLYLNKTNSGYVLKW